MVLVKQFGTSWLELRLSDIPAESVESNTEGTKLLQSPRSERTNATAATTTVGTEQEEADAANYDVCDDLNKFKSA